MVGESCKKSREKAEEDWWFGRTDQIIIHSGPQHKMYHNTQVGEKSMMAVDELALSVSHLSSLSLSLPAVHRMCKYDDFYNLRLMVALRSRL